MSDLKETLLDLPRRRYYLGLDFSTQQVGEFLLTQITDHYDL